MSSIRRLRRALLDGAMVVVPTGAVVLLGARHSAEGAGRVGTSGPIGHPVLFAVVLLALLCLGIGLFVRTAAGCEHGACWSECVRAHPGYRLAKAFTGDGPPAEHGGRTLRPALAAIEEEQCPRS